MRSTCLHSLLAVLEAHQWNKIHPSVIHSQGNSYDLSELTSSWLQWVQRRVLGGNFLWEAMSGTSWVLYLTLSLWVEGAGHTALGSYWSVMSCMMPQECISLGLNVQKCIESWVSLFSSVFLVGQRSQFILCKCKTQRDLNKMFSRIPHIKKPK